MSALEDFGYAEALPALKELERSPGWKLVLAGYDERVTQLIDTALSGMTGAEETQQIKRAIQELKNHGPDAVREQLLRTATHKIAQGG